MATNRLQKTGTIFSRVSGLIKAGAMEFKDRPIWFDVYRAYPPIDDPYFDRKPVKTDEQLKKILYKEDLIRAKFFRKFGSLDISNLITNKSKSLCDTFVEKYIQLSNEGKIPQEKIFDVTCKVMGRLDQRLAKGQSRRQTLNR